MIDIRAFENNDLPNKRRFLGHLYILNCDIAFPNKPILIICKTK
jgi:hypothetical protein